MAHVACPLSTERPGVALILCPAAQMKGTVTAPISWHRMQPVILHTKLLLLAHGALDNDRPFSVVAVYVFKAAITVII